MLNFLAGDRCLPLATRGFVGIVLLLLLFPSIGPLLDHHFAERDANHQHLYLGLPVPGHEHLYEAHHNHSHSHDQSPHHAGDDEETPSTVGEGPQDILFFTAQDGAGQSIVSIIAPTAEVRLSFAGPDTSASLHGYPHRESIPPGEVVSPPDKPPPA